jgi:hypothetical protein
MKVHTYIHIHYKINKFIFCRNENVAADRAAFQWGAGNPLSSVQRFILLWNSLLYYFLGNPQITTKQVNNLFFVLPFPKLVILPLYIIGVVLLGVIIKYK